MSRPPCSIDGCTNGARCGDMCVAHYKRWKFHGDPAHPGPQRLRNQTVDCPVCGTSFLFTGKGQTCGRSCGQRFRRMQTDRRRLSSTGYVDVWNPNHPLARSDGYVSEHRMVAWDHGIITDPGDHVHHVDHDKTNNHPSNLEALTPTEHILRHQDEAGYIENQFGRFPLLRGGECDIDGCSKPAKSRGWCSAHYTRWVRSGDPLGPSTWRGRKSA